tara:strand:- start:595 stop:1575 length:981 start_codon:yes stop_codon:yes gene_type:complete
MILKTKDLNFEKINNSSFFLFYGENQGFKEEIIKKYFKEKLEEIFTYDENQILNNKDTFYENVLSNSFFNNKKLIIINRISDKIFPIINEIIDRDISDIKVILKANLLEKKSKIRNLFEKNKKTICVAFYEDNMQTLSALTDKFLKLNKINLSQQNINIIIERAKGDRINLKNELHKIENLSKTKKKIETEDIIKLTNLAENFDVNELVNSSLAKNRRKTLNILNENNYGTEDVILILRVYLTKLKRLLKLYNMIKETKNVETAILSYKPPIFWKEKDLIKKQINSLSLNQVNKLISETNKIELIVKKNPNSALNIFTNYILEQTQ